MPLTEYDPKFWGPIPTVIDWIDSRIPEGASVLEVGPGSTPFRRATIAVDFAGAPDWCDQERIKCDFANEALPFTDKSFDFVYCRHVIEDLANPCRVLAEIERVGKAGYIETPSPVAECCRGVDGHKTPWRGYHHHRHLVWVRDGQLRLICKLPKVEYASLNSELIEHLLRRGPKYWNTYYLWRDSINVKQLTNPPDFNALEDYDRILIEAMNDSMRSSDAFWTMINQGRVHAL